MYQGQKCYGYVNGVQYQVLLFPMDYIAITQSPFNKYSHYCCQYKDSHGRCNSGCWDIVGKGGKQPIYAPCDCTCVYNAYENTKSSSITTQENNGNQTMFQSVNKVIYADGSLDYACFGFGHEGRDTCTTGVKSYTPICTYKGQKFKQGDLIGYTGCFGNSALTGIHSHVILVKGAYNGLPVYCNMFVSTNPIDIDEMFYGNGTQVTSTGESIKGGGATTVWKLFNCGGTPTPTDEGISYTNTSQLCYITVKGGTSNSIYDYKVTIDAPYHAGVNPKYASASPGSEWEYVARINGSFFYTWNSEMYAVGFEKANWTWNEYVDEGYANVGSIGTDGADNTTLTINTQANIGNYFSGEMAVTGGIFLSGGTSVSSAVNTSTGHTFIGQKSDGTIIMGAIKSGTSGSTGRSLISNMGYNGIEMDGGGSTYFDSIKGSYDTLYDGRTIKNVLFIYRKKRTVVTNRYTLTLNTSPTDSGVVKGAGTYDEGTLVTAEAVDTDKYKFIKWSNGSSEPILTFTLNQDITLTAYFEEVKKGIIINGYGGIDFQIL